MIYSNSVIRFLFLRLAFVGTSSKSVRYKNPANISLSFTPKAFRILGSKIYCGDFQQVPIPASYKVTLNFEQKLQMQNNFHDFDVVLDHLLKSTTTCHLNLLLHESDPLAYRTIWKSKSCDIPTKITEFIF